MTALAPTVPVADLLAADRSRRRTRIWRALIITSVLAGIGLTVGVVVTSAELLRTAAQSATDASPGWLAVSGAAMLISFVASATGIAGAAQNRVPIARTTAAEFAGTFCNRLTPAGVGRTALRVRYLVCAGLTVERAASAVALSSIVGAIAYLVGLAAAGMDVRWVAASIVVSPSRMAIFLGSVGLLGCAAGVLASSPRWQASRHRGMLAGHWTTLRCELRDLAHDRWAMLALFAGPLVSSVGYVFAFWASLQAVGVDLSVPTVAVLYVTATAVAAAVPMPGGVGAAEFTLTAALTAGGISPAAALSGVLVFRLMSLWIPSVIGVGALVWLEQTGALSRDGRWNSARG